MPLVHLCLHSSPTRRSSDLRVAVSAPLAPPSTAVVEPDRVTVALSLSVTLTAPVPAVLTEAFEVGADIGRATGTGHAASRGSGAITVRVLGVTRTGPTAKGR